MRFSNGPCERFDWRVLRQEVQSEGVRGGVSREIMWGGVGGERQTKRRLLWKGRMVVES